MTKQLTPTRRRDARSFAEFTERPSVLDATHVERARNGWAPLKVSALVDQRLPVVHGIGPLDSILDVQALLATHLRHASWPAQERTYSRPRIGERYPQVVNTLSHKCMTRASDPHNMWYREGLKHNQMLGIWSLNCLCSVLQFPERFCHQKEVLALRRQTYEKGASARKR